MSRAIWSGGDLATGFYTPFSSPDNLLSTITSKNAYCIFLDSDPDNYGDEMDTDPYFTSARMLLFQLWHNKHIRGEEDIPVVVLVTSITSQQKRARLAAEGAIVVQADNLAAQPGLQWIAPSKQRWKRAFDKLHVFRLTQFERILLLDADMVVVKPLYGIFSSSDAMPRQSNATSSSDQGIAESIMPLPPQYLLAANSGPYGNHSYPASRGTRFSPSFLLLQPSEMMYDYYLTIAKTQDSFSPAAPDTNLLNQVHAAQSSMPWVQIDPDWTVNSPNYNDYLQGIKSLHEKWWRCDHDLDLREVFLDIRWRMEGFWEAKARMVHAA